MSPASSKNRSAFTPAAAVPAGPLAFLRHLTGRKPARAVTASGDASVAAEVLRLRIPG